MQRVNRNPWEVLPETWKTESQFITWVRGVLRKGWSNFPIKLEYLKSARKRIKNTNPKSSKTHPTVWGWVCEQCNKEVTKVEVDHAGNVQGRFTCMDEIQGYAEHLYMVDYNSLQCVCIPCHKIRSLAQKTGLSFEEAALEKQVIAMCKKTTEEVVAFCKEYGYTDAQLSNAAKRREAVTNILRGK